MKKLDILLTALLLSAMLGGCGGNDSSTQEQAAEVAPPETPAEELTVMEKPEDPSQILTRVLADQPDATRARYGARHPEETLTFFGIKPGMTVVEALPGGGWYSKILIPYLGSEGQLIGVNYSSEMWPLFGFFGEEQIEAFKVWTDTWPAQAEAWRGDNAATLGAYEFGRVPESAAGTVDAVVLIRALHNLRRFEDQGGFLTSALADVYNLLKPGGIVGIVQHEAPADWTDEQSGGGRGYLRKDMVIALMEQAGFELEGESVINNNPRDIPGEGDVVWRLPPSMNGTADDPELRAAVEAIGESNRMTLRFRKPAQSG